MIIFLKLLLMKDENDNKGNLIAFFKHYSWEDLLTSFFILDLYLPNIASPIKMQYLYVVYEEIFEDLRWVNNITSYQDFTKFCTWLFKKLPSFSMIEDHIPEQDWWEIKYFSKDKSYKIFYGADLLNVYGFYSALELIHVWNDETYKKVLNRSFCEEFEFTLQIQNYIINNLKNSKSWKRISPWDIYFPSKKFWILAKEFLNKNIHDIFDKKLLDLYSYDNVKKRIDYSEFANNAYNWINCRYFFIKNNDKYFPVLPRKYCTVIYDIWGENIKYIHVKNMIDEKLIDKNITNNLAHYIKERLPNQDFLECIMPLEETSILNNIIFTWLVFCDERLILFYNTPIFSSEEDMSKIYDMLSWLFDFVKSNWLKHVVNNLWEIVEIYNPSYLLSIILIHPSINTSWNWIIHLPKKFPWHFFALDSFLAIIDEISDTNQLNDFLNFIQNPDNHSICSSTLDNFGAYIDSCWILTQGAFQPTASFIDPHFWTNFRYKSLSNFWKSFPHNNLSWHPMSWRIEPYSNKWVVLISKRYKDFFFCTDINKHTIYISAFFDSNMTNKECKVSEQMMNILLDELNIYQDQINELLVSRDEMTIQIIFYSNTYLCLNKDKMKDKAIIHIEDKEILWEVRDIIESGDNRIMLNIIFNDEIVFEAMQCQDNRTLEINLLLAFLKVLALYFCKTEVPMSLINLLEKDKTKKRRHSMFQVCKEASFPEYESVIKLSEKEYKKVTKEIAILLRDSNIQFGKFDNKKAKVIVHQIRWIIQSKIESMLWQYDFNTSISFVISKNDALHNVFFRDRVVVQESINDDRDYISEEELSDHHTEYSREVKNYRFLIEKMVQLGSEQKISLNEENLKSILSLIDFLLNLQGASDMINYGIDESGISIDEDYVLTINYPDNFKTKIKNYRHYLEKINLGIEWNEHHVPNITENENNFLDKLDTAFNDDFGFSMRHLQEVLKILSYWWNYNNTSDASYYSATEDEIIYVCKQNIKDLWKEQIRKILVFITLDSTRIMRTRWDKWVESLHDDLPIWEYYKRIYRYTLQPIVIVERKMLWWPYSTSKTNLVWQRVCKDYKLPANFDAPTTNTLFEETHQKITKWLETLINKIVSQYSQKNRRNLNPRKFDKGLAEDIWDFDVLSFIEHQNIILNIESKFIDNVYCLKDMSRIKEKIFWRIKENWTFQKWYLQKHEIRDKYIIENYKTIFNYLGWSLPNSTPQIVSLFVTNESSWWTAYPLFDSDVKFVEVRMLSKFIEDLISV